MKTHHIRLALAVLLSTSLLMIAAIPSVPAYGPREEYLTIYYGSQEAAYSELANGNIDIVLAPLDPMQAENAFANPDPVVAAGHYGHSW